MVVTGKIVRYGKKEDCFCLDDLKTWLKVRDTQAFKKEQLFSFAKSCKGQDVSIEFEEVKEGKFTNKYAIKINKINSTPKLETKPEVKQEVKPEPNPEVKQTSVPEGLTEVKVEGTKAPAGVEQPITTSSFNQGTTQTATSIFNPDKTKGETPAQGMDRLNRRTAMAMIVQGIFESMVGQVDNTNYKTLLKEIVEEVEKVVK